MSAAQTPLFTALLIDGELVAGQGMAEPILNPATGEVLTHIAEASSEQVEAAILAAHRAFAGWHGPRRSNARTCCWRSLMRSKRTPTCSPASNR